MNEDQIYNDLKEKGKIDITKKVVETFVTKDEKTFLSQIEAENHQSNKNIKDYIISLLGGNIKNEDFNNGKGYYKLNKEKYELAKKLILKFKNDLGLYEYPLQSRFCLENEYFKEISNVMSCIGKDTNNNFIRVCSPFFIQRRDKLGDICINKNKIKTSKIIDNIENLLNDCYKNQIPINEIKKDLEINVNRLGYQISKNKFKDKHVDKLEEILVKYVHKSTSILNKNNHKALSDVFNVLQTNKNNMRDKMIENHNKKSQFSNLDDCEDFYHK